MSSSVQRGAAALARIVALAMLVSLGACGGGGSSSPSPALTASAAADHATAGGQSVTLTAVASNSTDTVTWSLSGPGSLSATTGATVDYIPPGPDALDAGTQANITATLGTLTQTVVLNVATAPGATWETIQAPEGTAADVVQANGLYAMVTQEGDIGTSTDGTTWKPVPRTVSVGMNAITYGSAGYVAVGDYGTIVSSADGRTWTAQAPLSSQSTFSTLLSVAYGNGRYVAVGTGPAYTSTDAVNWTPDTVKAGSMLIRSIAFGSGRFVAAVDDGFLADSADGVNWTIQQQYQLSPQYVVYGNGRFVALGGTSTAVSTDGSSWSAPVTIAGISNGYAYLRFAGGHFFLFSNDMLAISTDGVTWTTSPAPTFASFNETPRIFTTTPSGDYVMLGGDGLVATSSDLATWSPVSGGRFEWDSVAWANGTYVAVDDVRQIWRSTDGRSWTEVTVDGKATGFRVVAANGLFFLFNSNGSVSTSSDGIAWTAHDTGLQDNLQGLAWGNGSYVGVSYSGNLVTSPDGASWSVSSTTPLAQDADAAETVAFGAGVFVAFDGDDHAFTSTDGVHWSRSPTEFGMAVGSVAYGPAGFVAMGETAMWHSTDGINWSQVDVPDVKSIRAVAYGDGRYVAVGGATPFTSTDGVHWTAGAAQFAGWFNAITFGADQFVAVGEGGEVAVSSH